MSYYVGKYKFASRAEVKRYLSEELQRRQDGDRVDDPKLAYVLSELAREHPQPDEKIGPGIEHWVVTTNTDLHHRKGNKGFRVKQFGKDELVEFGYTKVLYPPSDVEQLSTALTEEARDITEQFRTDAFKNGPVICFRTGELVTEKTLAQAVHRNPSRAVLHSQFLAQEGLNVKDIELKVVPGVSGKRLVDRGLRDRWRAFQLAHLDGMAIAKL
jgi:hypothetical protein